MDRPLPQASSGELRSLRTRLRLSQPQFAALLGVSAETYRTWALGGGRCLTPGSIRREASRPQRTPTGYGRSKSSLETWAFTFALCEMRLERAGCKSHMRIASCSEI